VAIPTVIHQVFGLKGDRIPPLWDEWIRQWRLLHPGFDHILWDEATCSHFVRKHDKGFWDTWTSIPRSAYILKSDYIRVLLLYVNGGFYFDCDVRPLSPLVPLIRKEIDCVLFSEGDGFVSNAGMGFSAGHRICANARYAIRKHIRKLLADGRSLSSGNVLNKTGPTQLKLAAVKCGVDLGILGPDSLSGYMGGSIVDRLQAGGALVCPVNALCDHATGNDNLFGFHTCGATWRPKKGEAVDMRDEAILTELRDTK